MAYADNILFIAIITFFFSNNVNPVAEYNFHNLRKSLARAQAKSQALYSAISMGACLAISIAVSGDPL